VSKGSAPEELLGAARRVCSGGVYLSEDIARELALQAVPGGHAVDALSPREFEVFRLLAAGHSIADIARSLSLSHKTIANYQSAIKQKLEADTSAQMVWIALRRGIVGAPDTSSD
jgi:DNA-binding NarL/FixJ family response regulator